MSDSKQGGGEPSMEEILASIRKIISEDTAEDGSKSPQRDDSAEASPQPTDRQAEDGDASGGGPESSDDDVLELSDEPEADDGADDGADDDAPLDLTEEAPASETDAASGDGDGDGDAPLDLDEPVDGDGDAGLDAGNADTGNVDTGNVDAGNADDNADDRAAGDAGGGNDIGEFEAAEPADETAFLADPFDDTTSGAAAPDTAAEAALAAGAAAGGAGAGQAAGGSPDQRSEDTASPLGPEDQRVVSETAEQQAVEQLTSLARQAEDSPSGTPADNVDHILARMVRDALRPQLREWMDRNLPQIVERIVREEVQRMTRRAQGLEDDGRY